MHVFFADDSSQIGIRSVMGRVVAFGGLLVDAEKLASLERALGGAAKAFGFPDGEEFKWSPHRKTWMHGNLIGQQRDGFFAHILRVAIEHECVVIVAAIDTGRTRKQGDDAFQFALDLVFERITTCLAKANSTGLIVADRPGGGHKEDNALLHSFLERVQSGTDYVPPDRIALNILTTPSHLVRALQLADVVTGITTAMVCGQAQFAATHFPAVKQMMLKNALGYVGGTGLKLFPNELINLYHWVLGEGAFTKAASGLGYRLPTQGYSYFQSGT